MLTTVADEGTSTSGVSDSSVSGFAGFARGAAADVQHRETISIPCEQHFLEAATTHCSSDQNSVVAREQANILLCEAALLE